MQEAANLYEVPVTKPFSVNAIYIQIEVIYECSDVSERKADFLFNRAILKAILLLRNLWTFENKNILKS